MLEFFRKRGVSCLSVTEGWNTRKGRVGDGGGSFPSCIQFTALFVDITVLTSRLNLPSSENQAIEFWRQKGKKISTCCSKCKNIVLQ
ncbi:hypothetical protein T4B_812 [Trichinella pseudospiralis]|uniref:Uncharacterized protein n=1 Tax=Trichinella pseudospiralis TaxID=6337 RepID=A0A0V1KAI1_TRIPS|nr:hypothetical protein T4A_9551 [Trichinella pseudospiralis]KRZ35074.1 hypothetical protein T4B_812 [Trichinella pseudospiralis]KRZ44196.1 hypothetical protein T4C_7435 [Trichinella pseudospiralis]